MISFKSVTDLNQLSPQDPAYEVIKEQIHYLIEAYDPPDRTYDPEADGWIVLIEEGDVDRQLNEIWPDGYKLVDVPWEGATMNGDFINAIFLANNDFGISFIIPDKPYVNGKLRETLNEILDY